MAVAPERFLLVPVLAFLFLLPSRDPVASKVLLLTTVLILAQTHIQPARMLLQDIRWIGLALFLATGLTIERVRSGSGPFPPTAVLIVLGVIVIGSGVSIAVSIAPAASIGRYTAFVAMILLGFGIVFRGLRTTEQIERLAAGFLVIAAVVTAASILYDLMDGRDRASRLGGRLMGVLGNPNALGDLAGLLLPLATWRFLWRRPREGGIVVLLLVAALIMSEARSAIAAAAVGTGFVLIGTLRPAVASRGASRGRLLAGAGVAGAVMVLVLYFVRPETFWVLGGRTEHWSLALRFIMERPWLGYGFGAEDRILDWAGVRLVVGQGALFHNTFLGLALQTGVLVAGFFIAVWGGFVAASVRTAWSAPSSSVAGGLTGCLLAGTVTMVFESWAFSPGSPFAFMFWVLVVMRIRQTELDSEIPVAVR